MRGAVTLGLGLLALTLAACGDSGGASSNPAKISVDEKRIPQTAVGQPEEVQFTVVNKGTGDVQNLIVADLLKDFKAHNVITGYTCDPMGCQEDTNSAGFGDILTIGKLAVGQTVTIDIKAVAKDAGNFTYNVQFLDLGDNASDPNLTNADDGKVDSYTVDETVLPS